MKPLQAEFLRDLNILPNSTVKCSRYQLSFCFSTSSLKEGKNKLFLPSSKS